MRTASIHPNALQFIQTRLKIDQATVAEYVELMTAGIEFDPAQAIEDEAGVIFVWDGNHRGAAAQQMDAPLRLNIEPGAEAEAEWLALSANQKHGLRRSRADKRFVVRQALLHPQGVQTGNREIARHCGVDPRTVARMRTEMEAAGEIPSQAGHETAEAGGNDDDHPPTTSRAQREDATPPADHDAEFENAAPALPPQPQQRTLRFAQVNRGGVALEITLYIDGQAQSVPVTAMFAHGPIAGLPEMSVPEQQQAALILPYAEGKRLGLVYLDNVPG
jgi:hypothetical protein